MRFPRASGILLHPTSLPGPHGSGDFGAAAYHFVDWLVSAGQRLWQILPLGGIGPGNSPYTSTSAFAGNVLMIDLEDLQRRGWLDAASLVPDPGFDAARVRFEHVIPWRMARLRQAAQGCFAAAAAPELAAFAAFCQAQADWLDDYALFMTLSDEYPGTTWSDWPAALARRDARALAEAAQVHAGRVRFWKFCQWQFFSQWARLKAYANERDVRLVGDAPIFIALHSADVWARPDLFELDAQGRPTVVAGVPPDFFSATGQRWGNPLYRWSAHAREGYAWWVERVRRIFELVDVVRIDHFRGFAGYWEIPADAPTAEVGRWLPGPGAALFEAVAAALGPLPIIAEDLGVITPDVEALRKRFAFPGMRILQFAWGEGPDGALDGPGAGEPRYLPHRHEHDTVVYPGTHDNDTSVGWWHAAPESARHQLREYLATDGRDIAWDLIRTACASVADTAVHPMQDVLSLDGRYRMNLPGLPEGNWGWRLQWSQVEPWHARRLRRLCQLTQRLAGQLPEGAG